MKTKKGIRYAPLFWEDFKNSERVKAMWDYQRYWYLSLLMEMIFNTQKPGFVPNDIEALYRLAGSRRLDYFKQHSKPVLDCLEATPDGQWLTNRRAVEVMTDVLQRIEKKPEAKKDHKSLLVSFSLDSPEVLIFNNYPRREGKQYALKCINKQIQGLIGERIAYLDSSGCEVIISFPDETMAAKFLHEAVIEFSRSPAGNRFGPNGEDLRPHPSTWFNQGRYEDDRREWYREAGNDNKASIGRESGAEDTTPNSWVSR